MSEGRLGFIDTPAQGNTRPDVAWCADNGCFGKGYPGDTEWFAWLTKHAADAGTCAFAVAPDVVGDAAATLARSLPWLPRIRALGYPAALVAQNGLESLPVPWDEFDVLFIGGDTEWKLGRHARQLVREAKLRGKRVHMGRVNSARRYRYAEHIGCDSVDGTFLTFGPDVNLPRLLGWQREPLFGGAAMSPRFVCMIDHLGACAAEHPSGGHYCSQPADTHGSEHRCICGHFWGYDPALEAAIRACIAFYSDPEPANPYAPDARPPYILPRRIALAACQPLDSRWRAVAQANQGARP